MVEIKGQTNIIHYGLSDLDELIKNLEKEIEDSIDEEGRPTYQLEKERRLVKDLKEILQNHNY